MKDAIRQLPSPGATIDDERAVGAEMPEHIAEAVSLLVTHGWVDAAKTDRPVIEVVRLIEAGLVHTIELPYFGRRDAGRLGRLRQRRPGWHVPTIDDDTFVGDEFSAARPGSSSWAPPTTAWQSQRVRRR